MKILVIQNKVMHYNKPLYNFLSEHYDTTILHSGDLSKTKEDIYNEIVVSVEQFGPFMIQRNLYKIVQSYDVVIALFDVRWIVNILILFSKRKGQAFIWWGIGFGKNWFANKVRLWLSKKSDATILYTEEAKLQFSKFVDTNKLFVANNTFYIQDRIRCYENKNKNIILFVGSLDKRKNNKLLLNSFQIICNSIDNISLVMIGDGDEYCELSDIATQFNLENRIQFKGKITNTEELKEFYRCAIVSISLGQAGLSVLQSLGYGVPFMATSTAISGGEISNIKHLENGIMCESNIDSVSYYLKKLCTDIELSANLGKNAYEYYTKYATMENMVNSFIQAIEYTGKIR